MKKLFLFLFLIVFFSCESAIKIPKGATSDEMTEKPPYGIDYYTFESKVLESKLGLDREVAYNDAISGLLTNISNEIYREVESYAVRNLKSGGALSDSEKQDLERIIKASTSGVLSCQIFKASLRYKKYLYMRLAVSKREANEIAKVNAYQNLIKAGYSVFQDLLDKLIEEINSDEWKRKKEEEIKELKKWEYDYQSKLLSIKDKK